MNHNIIGRGFKFAEVLQRKPDDKSFTPKEYQESIKEALRQLPADLAVTEITTETEVGFVKGKDEIEMQTIIYWKQ